MITKAILSDVDGRLVDSNRLQAQAWADAFAQIGITIPVDAVQGRIGKGGDTLMLPFSTRPSPCEAAGSTTRR